MNALEQFLAHTVEVEAAAAQEFAGVADARALTEAQNKFLGRSNSERARLLSELGGLGGGDKPEAGRRYNAVVKGLEQLLADASSRVASTRAPVAAVADKSMPARELWRGSKHPIQLVTEEIIAIFREIGFTIAVGPEAEREWYNFGALNFPADHPAMDLHDTLYVDRPGLLLRTHTSPVQMRTLQRFAPPVRVLAPGNVYRRDFFDATHAPMFNQLEGLAIDEGISFADLKAALMLFVRRFYGPGVRVRYGPSYFPFTEPSAQMDVEFDAGDGKGKRWMEILGCGLVHPAVLESAGIDSEKYSGWAFGMGPARIAMTRYGIPDIRLFYDSDVRFLEQFA